MLLVTMLVWTAHAELARAAMVTQTSGGSTCQSKPLRPLQVLGEGSTIDVPSGASLRLVYLESGCKESVSGPCQLRVGSAESKILSNDPDTRVVVEQASKGTTKLRKSENIRRMGGSLQAYADKSTGELIAMVTGIDESSPNYVPPQTGQARTVAIDRKTLRMVGIPRASANPDVYRELRWRGGAGPYRVHLLQEDEEVAQATVDKPLFVVPKEVRFIPGKVYKLVVESQESQASLRHDFTVLLPSEQNALQADIKDFAALLGGGPKEQAIARISVEQEWGLWTEALADCRTAIHEYPDDPGLQAELGRTLLLLGELEEARQALNMAATMGGP
jgi:hypothetical protein